ncbi:MAG: hypothetical protein A2474_01200 [Elusimicrobia bacterium RIFOXYC2_FULL_34_12]|nr:MAG: hypothetical protein A2474_01200 [Elusimicrobia bacterium RIFOXYC2_FULL_34_12]OGS38072.1 MAG: hypothetical protein A2551_02600 [Elusimicrobia bacterium RIFOXYD2_FULL_34_30]HAM39089.1 hypothetical protein [Elusimicrobiota bacterium]
MNRYIAILLIMFIIHVKNYCYASDNRNIASFTYHALSSEDSYTIFENTYIRKISKKYSLLLKMYLDNRELWNNSIFYIGPIININANTYIEIDYGHGRDSDKNDSDYIFIEATKEYSDYLYGMSLKHGILENSYYDIFSLSGKYYLNKKLGLKGKYFLVRGSDKKYNHSILSEAEYGIYKDLKVNGGLTVGDSLIDQEYFPQNDASFYSFFAGANYQYLEKYQFKYILEKLFQKNDINDTKHSFVIDIIF